MREATASPAELRNEQQSVLEHLDGLRAAALNLMEGQRLEAVPALWRWMSFKDYALLPHFELGEKTITPMIAQKPGLCGSLAHGLMKGGGCWPTLQEGKPCHRQGSRWKGRRWMFSPPQ